MTIPPAQRLDGVEEYYFSRKLAEIRQMEADGTSIINLGIGSPDMSPSASTIERLSESARAPRHHGYQPYKGIRELRLAIARYYARTYNTEVHPEQEIFPLIGSKEGVLYLSLAFLNEGDIVLIPDPGYPTYSSVTRLVGAVRRGYEVSERTRWLPDFAAIESEGMERVKLMWVNYPHMPTGANPPIEALQQIVDFARRHRILIGFDNPYSAIIHEGSPQSILACSGARDVAVELNSLSKSHNMAGWRIGWAVGAKEHVDAILRVATNIESGMFLPLQHAAVEALNTPDEWYRNLREEYRRRRSHGEAIMQAIGCSIPPGQSGMFVWARIPDGSPGAEAFVDALLKDRRIFLAPGIIFGENGERHVRLSLCSNVDVFQQALARIEMGGDTRVIAGGAL
jgi:LL-diaminopimelate aminotransferase